MFLDSFAQFINEETSALNMTLLTRKQFERLSSTVRRTQMRKILVPTLIKCSPTRKHLSAQKKQIIALLTARDRRHYTARRFGHRETRQLKKQVIAFPTSLNRRQNITRHFGHRATFRHKKQVIALPTARNRRKNIVRHFGNRATSTK